MEEIKQKSKNCQPGTKAWKRKIDQVRYKFFKEYLAILPINVLNDMYQLALKRYHNDLFDGANLSDENFYKSQAWRKTRLRALTVYGKACKICGRTSLHVPLHVDHIRARWLHPELALDLTNLRVLCEDCNLGKGSKIATSPKVLEKVILRRLKQPGVADTVE